MSNITLRQVEDELLRRKREDPLRNVYIPNPNQILVHENRAPITLVLGGNRTGKSYVAVAEAILYCLGRSTYAEVPDPPVTVWYVMPSLGNFKRGIRPILDKLIPMDVIAHEDTKYRIITFKNGSTLHFMSADQRVRRMQGASVDFIVIDEPMPKAVFEELTARLMDRRGRLLMVLTPVDDKPDNWIWVRDDLYVPYETGERKDINIIFMPVADSEGHSLVPHFTDEDIKKMEERWPDPAVRASRMYGHFVTRAGLVFSALETKIHVIPRFPVPETWQRWITVDPQYHRFAALFFAADDEGNYYITDEYYSQDEHLAYRAERMKAILGSTKLAIPCYVDSANPQDIAELNYHFNRVGAKIGAIKLPMQKRVETMILRVHSMLEPSDQRKYHWRTGRKNIYGAPRLLFFSDLCSTWDDGQQRITASRLMWEMKRLSWTERGAPDKDSAGGGDCCDALIYGCSISATGRAAEDTVDPYKDMKPEDALIWRAIDQMDQRERMEDEFRWIS